jgi:plastocyanin
MVFTAWSDRPMPVEASRYNEQQKRGRAWLPGLTAILAMLLPVWLAPALIAPFWIAPFWIAPLWIAPLWIAPLWIATAQGATVTATVTDDKGRLLPDAVVMITPADGTPVPPLEHSRLASAIVDQKDETFVPFVTVIRTGGSVSFRNSDPIRHHVYSFSPVRQFEMVETPGETSPPVRFDRPGSVAVGCNIHDQMIAYIHVTDAPWALVTDASGRAVITGVPAGHFVATVWHPRLRPGAEPAAVALLLANENSSLAVALPVLPARRTRPTEY